MSNQNVAEESGTRKRRKKTGRYGTMRELCEDLGITDARVAYYADELGKMWIKGSDDPARFRAHLREKWRSGQLKVKDICDWITDLVETGARVKAPGLGEAGTIILPPCPERDELLQELAEAYDDLILSSLRFTADYVDSRVGGVFGHYTAWLMRELGTKIKLLWALLGFSGEECNMKSYLEYQGNITEAQLLPLLKAAARAKGIKSPPQHLVKMTETPEVEAFREEGERGEKK